MIEECPTKTAFFHFSDSGMCLLRRVYNTDYRLHSVLMFRNAGFIHFKCSYALSNMTLTNIMALLSSKN